MPPLPTLPNPVILFDGVCNLCTGSVQFIIRHDPQHRFRFASLQSAFGQGLMQEFNLPAEDSGSFILWEENKIYTKSTGALRVTKKLNKAWPLLYMFIILPPVIRDGIYGWVAKNRYKWFGKKEVCWVPTPGLKDLFMNE